MPWCLISLLQYRNLPPSPGPSLGVLHHPRWQGCLRTMAILAPVLSLLVPCAEAQRRLAPLGCRLNKHHLFTSHCNAISKQCFSRPGQQPQPPKANYMLSFMHTETRLWNMQKSLCFTLNCLKNNSTVAKLSNFCISFKHRFFPRARALLR